MDETKYIKFTNWGVGGGGEKRITVSGMLNIIFKKKTER